MADFLPSISRTLFLSFNWLIMSESSHLFIIYLNTERMMSVGKRNLLFFFELLKVIVEKIDG